eukprot:GHUV01020863.1.p1 GENE.GHUV01020863.1~~GHUV01020863.1.p1  ORF type:complete len:215 (-),score=32.57 GHUV01020863.1:381-1025(-)
MCSCFGLHMAPLPVPVQSPGNYGSLRTASWLSVLLSPAAPTCWATLYRVFHHTINSDAVVADQVREGLYYNPYFPGGAIAMPRMIADGGVEYDDGIPSNSSQQAKVRLGSGRSGCQDEMVLSHFTFTLLCIMWVAYSRCCGGVLGCGAMACLEVAISIMFSAVGVCCIATTNVAMACLKVIQITLFKCRVPLVSVVSSRVHIHSFPLLPALRRM